MEKTSFTGTVEKMKIICYQPFLIRYTLKPADRPPLNCIVHQHAYSFFHEVDEQSQVAVYGHFNSKKQFVTEKYLVRNPKAVNVYHTKKMASGH